KFLPITRNTPAGDENPASSRPACPLKRPIGPAAVLARAKEVCDSRPAHARPAYAAVVIGSILLAALASPSQVSSEEAERFSIVIRGVVVDGPHRTIRATQGTMLELAFATDETVELHLHGYDRHLTVHPGEEAVMRLDAKVAGRFAIEAHRFEGPAGGPPSRGHAVLLYLEIHPR